MLAASFVLLSSNEITLVRQQGYSMRALYVAEAGVETATEWLRSQSSPPVSTHGPVSENITMTGYTGSSSYTITPDSGNPTPPALGTYEYTISSTGTVEGTARKIEATEEIQITTFSRYSYFTSYESYLIWIWWWQIELPVWFTTGTFLEGPVHTNDQYHISGDPIFDGPVSSVANTINYMHGGPPNDNPDFRQGITLGADSVDISPLTSDSLETAAAEADGYTFSGNTAMVLNSDGTMDVTNSGLDPTTQNMPLPNNGALFVTGGDLEVSGTLNGVLTAGSDRDVVLMGDIHYNTDPRTTPSSTDALALIAERDVVVDSNASDSDPDNDLEIFASLLAIGQEPTYGDSDGSLYVENYWSGLRGVLTIYGGIIQKRRGPVGTFYPWNNQKASGYDKDYHYDTRMGSNPPPHLPRTTSKARVSWKESQ